MFPPMTRRQAKLRGFLIVFAAILMYALGDEGLRKHLPWWVLSLVGVLGSGVVAFRGYVDNSLAQSQETDAAKKLLPAVPQNNTVTLQMTASVGSEAPSPPHETFAEHQQAIDDAMGPIPTATNVTSCASSHINGKETKMQEPIDFDLADIQAAATGLGWGGNFTRALGFTLPAEGIYWEDVPGDPGGATCCGVTQSCYDTYRQSNDDPTQPVKIINAAEVCGVYWHQNWLPMHCDTVGYPLALVLFDTSVNVGVSQAVKFEQRVLGLPADGVIGPNTEAAEKEFVLAHGVLALANDDIARRNAFYDEIGAPGTSLNQFLAGWLSRDNSLQQTADAAA